MVTHRDMLAGLPLDVGHGYALSLSKLEWLPHADDQMSMYRTMPSAIQRTEHVQWGESLFYTVQTAGKTRLGMRHALTVYSTYV